MKNYKAQMMKQILCLSTIFLAGASLSSAVGPGEGGGGDGTEIRVDEIRADILRWINAGGGSALQLPEGLTLADYKTAMTKSLKPGAVQVGFVTTKQEANSSDPELKVSVAGQPKTCRGFLSKKDHLPHILCNKERFEAEGNAKQYQLIHHEYAGLAGVEKNIGAKSDYRISNQITDDSFEPTTVLRLAIGHTSGQKVDECGTDEILNSRYRQRINNSPEEKDDSGTTSTAWLKNIFISSAYAANERSYSHTIAERIKDCSRRPISTKIVAYSDENPNGVMWNLVARKRDSVTGKYHEVWKDSRSGLVWGDMLNSHYTHYQAVKMDSDNKKVIEETACASKEGQSANVGINEKSFGLPTRQEFAQAKKNGIMEIGQKMTSKGFWSSSVEDVNSYDAWGFSSDSYSIDGYENIGNRDATSHIDSVRCVGRQS